MITFGFASYQDGSFELIIQKEGVETTLKGQLDPGQLAIVDRILPTCVFVPVEPKAAQPRWPTFAPRGCVSPQDPEES